MTKIKNEASFSIKRTKPRYIVINENIYEALDQTTLALYMAFRYEADYSKEDAIIRRSSKFLYEKAKISRRQFFKSLNILENHGLVLRDSSSQLGVHSIYHVAQDLGYFNTDCGVVHSVHGGVHLMHTYNQYSLSLIKPNTISENSEKAVIEDEAIHVPTEIVDGDQSVLRITEEVISEIVETYHDELPDLPKIRKVDKQLRSQLSKMIKDWPTYQKDGKKFSIQSFRDYLNLLKTHYSWFLKPYNTEMGNKVRCSLRKLTREVNISKVVNGEFSAN